MRKSYPILYDVASITFRRSLSNQEILYLFKEIFRRTFQEDILEWYAACPHGSNIWYGAFHNDTPVGMYALLPMQFRLNNLIYRGALCNNVGVVPEFQGKGLFQSLGEYALRDSNFPIVVGIPNAKAVKGHKRIGWKSYGVLELLHGEVEAVAENQVISKFCRENFIFPETEQAYQFLVNRDLSWLKWRYSKPGYKYIQSVFQGNRYIVWKEYEKKKQILECSDYTMALELQGEIDIWQFLGSSGSKYLKQRTFLPILQNEFILYLNSEVELNLDPNSVKFELGDNDVF